VNVRGIAFILLALAGFWVGLQGGEYRPFGAGFALLGLFFAATFLGRAGRIAVALRPVVGRTVRVQVWGAPLPGSGELLFDASAIIALGAGLLLHLQPESGEAGAILKVAQPGAENLGDERIEIGTAAYVQWAGRKVERPPGSIAPALALLLP